MKYDPQTLLKALSPKLAAKAIQAFDRGMTVVVGACWGAALLMMIFALYTASLSAAASRAAEEAEAAEPILPKTVRQPVEPHDLEPMIERLQHRYMGISFSLGTDRALTVSCVDVNKFREWLTALSYIDTISPEYRWSLREFCVGGGCKGGALMIAVLTGEKISFAAPSPGD